MFKGDAIKLKRHGGELGISTVSGRYALLLWFVPAFLTFFLNACSHHGPNVFVRSGVPFSAVRKVAVFPFFNNTGVEEASRVVTGAFIAGLFGTERFQIEFPGNIKSFLVEERVVVRTGIDLATIRTMGKRLGVDAVVLGQVDEYVKAGNGTGEIIPVVSISSRMIDTRDGMILFMAHHRRTGDDFITILDYGKVRSAGELAGRMVGEIVAFIP